MPPWERHSSTKQAYQQLPNDSSNSSIGSNGTADAMLGFRARYPTNRTTPLRNADMWLEGKRIDDAVDERLWRVHDKLYDLKDFLHKHPGGRFWLETTRGMDITEAFEASHINPSVSKILDTYYVRDATGPRNSPYTFKEDGFYRTLKRKAWPIISRVGSGPSLRILVQQDSMVVLFVSLMLAAAYCHSYLLAIAAAVALAMTVSMAHNFFHQADNFRMLYFDLSPLSSAEWRITHGMSHHLFTNTLYDFEVSVLEPFMYYLPHPDKGFHGRYLAPITCHITLFLIFFMEVLLRIVGLALGKRKFRWENLFPLVEAALMVAVAGDVKIGLSLWLVMVCCSGFVFAYPALIGSHHHPDIYHAHDASRSQPDWGLFQMDAVRDRVEVTGSLFLVSIAFGDHTLHHLFPTVDHSKLPFLYPVFLETCRQFDINFTFLRQSNMWAGMYRQMVSTTPNKSKPGYAKNTKVLLADSVMKMEKQKIKEKNTKHEK